MRTIHRKHLALAAVSVLACGAAAADEAQPCSAETLSGTYIFSASGWSAATGAWLPKAIVETIHFNALGGVDNVKVHDLSGTDVTEVVIDLAAAIGGTAGDGQVDTLQHVQVTEVLMDAARFDDGGHGHADRARPARLGRIRCAG